MSANQIFFLIVSILVIDFAIKQVASFLNLRYKPEDIPEDLAALYNGDEQTRLESYHKEQWRLSFVSGALELVLLLLVLFTGLFAYVDALLANVIGIAYLRGVAFILLFALVSDLISLPFEVYGTFSIEARYGFNTTTAQTFVMDKLKSYAIAGLIFGLLIACLLLLIEGLGPSFWWWFWLIAASVTVFFGMFYTSWLLPLFNKLEPLPNNELRQAIEGYAAKMGFQLTDTYVMDGSKRSNKANAFFSGLGPQKKVVLFDTLIEQFSTDEIVAVMAHEVGHYRKRHIPVLLAVSVAQMGLILFLLSLFMFSSVLSQALGSAEVVFHLNLLAFALLFSPIKMLIDIAMNALSRRFEYQADAFAAESFQSEAMRSALKRLGKNTLSKFAVHPLTVLLYYSHPPIMQRLQALRG